jgi:hypothetical protein
MNVACKSAVTSMIDDSVKYLKLNQTQTHLKWAYSVLTRKNYYYYCCAAATNTTTTTTTTIVNAVSSTLKRTKCTYTVIPDVMKLSGVKRVVMCNTIASPTQP